MGIDGFDVCSSSLVVMFRHHHQMGFFFPFSNWCLLLKIFVIWFNLVLLSDPCLFLRFWFEGEISSSFGFCSSFAHWLLYFVLGMHSLLIIFYCW